MFLVRTKNIVAQAGAVGHEKHIIGADLLIYRMKAQRIMMRAKDPGVGLSIFAVEGAKTNHEQRYANLLKYCFLQRLALNESKGQAKS